MVPAAPVPPPFSRPERLAPLPGPAPAAERSAAPMSVQVTIGRIDVWAAPEPEPAAAPTPTPPSAGPTTLSEYLARRNGTGA